MWGSIGYGVAFPDGEVSTRPLQYGPSEIVIDSNDVRDHRLLQERVEALLTYWNRSQSYDVGRRAMSVLVDTVAHDYRVRTLRTSVEESEHELVSLSEPQFRLLECMDSNKRVAVAGCAGSGKTLLALEKARRLAASGMRTLLTCFNRPLADHLRRVASDEPRLLICTFHQLCIHLATQAGLKTHRGSIPNEEYYDKVLPGLLLDAVERLQPDFDAIVVDEGQNFDKAWWDYLLITLRDSSSGTFYLFYDDNQSLYDRPLGLPPDMFSFRLQENWRNTRRIYELVSRYYSGEPVVARGPLGISVEHIGVTKKEELRTELRRVLHRCCNQEGLASDDVVVLTPRNTDRSGLLGEYGSYCLVDAPSRPHEIQLSSVFHFQGLESKVVVIAGVRNRDQDFRELMYVACSRARSHLVVIAYGAEPAAALEADSAPSRRPSQASLEDNL
jgi:superfamily I DNA/RNA helicase